MYVGSFKPCHSRQLQEMPNNLLAPISTPVAERQQEPVSSPDVEVEYFEDDLCDEQSVGEHPEQSISADTEVTQGG